MSRFDPIDVALSRDLEVEIMPSRCECGRELKVEEIKVTGDGIEPYTIVTAYCPPPCNTSIRERAS